MAQHRGPQFRLEWTPERLALVKLHYYQGFTARESAVKIGAGCTKYMVQGKRDRMGLNPPGVPREEATKTGRKIDRKLRIEAAPEPEEESEGFREPSPPRRFSWETTSG